MGLRFESNYQRIAGLAPYLPDDDPLSRWFRIHEWQVDAGFIGILLMVMINVEPQFPIPTTADYGWVRLRAITDTTTNSWTTRFECKMIGSAMTGQQYVPRLTILPAGDGITFTAGQGLMTQGLGGSTTSYRWWSCYAIDARSA